MRIKQRCRNAPPAYGTGLRLAVYQPRAGLSGSAAAIERAIGQMEDAVRAACAHQAQLISFPELYLTGYAFKDSNPGAHDVAVACDGPVIGRVREMAAAYGIALLCPYPERATVAGQVRHYDAMVLIDRDGGVLKNYRKTQLWGPDERRLWDAGYVFAEEGAAFTTHPVNGFPVGLLNCYEAEFAELSRIHALNGAKLIVIPTAADEWAMVAGSKTDLPYPDATRLLIPAHAFENGIFIAYNNYTGVGFIEVDGAAVEQVQYLGNSMVCDPYGDTLLAARKTEETLLIVDCLPEDYGRTHPCDTDYLEDRRPELYGGLVGV